MTEPVNQSGPTTEPSPTDQATTVPITLPSAAEQRSPARKVVVVGCGRVGAELARLLDVAGHDVTIVDPDPEAFRRLAPGFRGTVFAGDGLDPDVLRLAGIERADAFVALTDGDNHNIMATEIAKHMYRVPTVISQIKDPLRGEAFDALGIEHVSPTILGADRIRQVMGA